MEERTLLVKLVRWIQFEESKAEEWIDAHGGIPASWVRERSYALWDDSFIGDGARTASNASLFPLEQSGDEPLIAKSTAYAVQRCSSQEWRRYDMYWLPEDTVAKSQRHEDALSCRRNDYRYEDAR